VVHAGSRESAARFVLSKSCARATHAPLALDRFWRNARVHTLHDPLDYRVRDAGRYALTGTLPKVSLYT
jgi:hypothetical protein